MEAIDEVLTMDPPPDFNMWGIAAQIYGNHVVEIFFPVICCWRNGALYTGIIAKYVEPAELLHGEAQHGLHILGSRHVRMHTQAGRADSAGDLRLLARNVRSQYARAVSTEHLGNCGAHS
jgi:hypothetical protein